MYKDALKDLRVAKAAADTYKKDTYKATYKDTYKDALKDLRVAKAAAKSTMVQGHV